MPKDSAIKLTTHVGRDILQSAASFKTDYAVVWEYVANSIQYVDDGVLPKVHVTIHPRGREITISDNGSGMSPNDLTRFFKMHDENADRLRGRPGRGKFGTGKSAAFGIGGALTVDTRRDGVRNVLKLTRDRIIQSDGSAIPLEYLVRDEATNAPNGTTIVISDIALPKINTQGVIEYIERHLQVHRARLPEVAVNDHVCEYREPQVSQVHQFQPSADQRAILGDVTLTIKVSPTPLPPVEVGIAVTAGLGNLVAKETAGVDRKELGNFLFGEIDVPALETSESIIEPYDASRSLQLNAQHPVAAVLISFIGARLEDVRKTQVQNLSEARKTEQARRLAAQASKIEEILNQDFRHVMTKLQGIRAAASHQGTAGARFGGSGGADSDEGAWLEGMDQPGEIDKSNRPSEAGTSKGRSPPDIPSTGQPSVTGKRSLDQAGGAGRRSAPRGGFRVEYRELGEKEDRSQYDRTTLAILINLNHRSVSNALRSTGVEDPTFRRLSYEIAFTEYSIALGYEMAERDPEIPADDLLFEVRSTLNRVAASAASLYI